MTIAASATRVWPFRRKGILHSSVPTEVETPSVEKVSGTAARQPPKRELDRAYGRQRRGSRRLATAVVHRSSPIEVARANPGAATSHRLDPARVLAEGVRGRRLGPNLPNIGRRARIPGISGPALGPAARLVHLVHVRQGLCPGTARIRPRFVHTSMGSGIWQESQSPLAGTNRAGG